MWFRWEHSAIGWTSVVYHVEPPKAREGAAATHDVPADCIGQDGDPKFGTLQARFPKPVEVLE
jgi:hypothetical protein